MKKFIALQTLVLFVATSPNLSGQTFSGIFVFGDSLSDVGNDLVDTEGAIPPSPPYFEGRFSDGPVWVEHVASELGLDASIASLLGGNNYAYGGAQTGTGTSTLVPVPNVGPQIDAFLATGSSISASDLIVLWAGHNDITGNIADNVILENLSGHITTLHSNGARNFLIGNMFDAPNLNSQLAKDVNTLSQDLAVSVAIFDFDGLVQEVFSNPGTFGFTNTGGPACRDCGNGTQAGMDIAANPEGYVLWDDIHPSATMHSVMGDRALEAVATIPQPPALGDLDGDGTVAFTDFLILSANFGQAGGPMQGDIDGNGQIGFPDFLVLSANFGQTVGVGAQSVPEPSSLALFGVGAMLIGLNRRGRR